MGRRLRGRQKPQPVRESIFQPSDVGSKSDGANPKSSDAQVLSASPSECCDLFESENISTRSSSELIEPSNRQPRLQPITSFSTVAGFSGDILPSLVSSGVSGGSIVRNSSVIEILVHLLCREREPDHVRRELLFKALCNGIKKWNNPLYLPLHAFPGLQDFRGGLLNKFEFLFEEVQSQISSDPSKLIIQSFPIPSIGNPLTQLALTNTCQNQFLDDRYSREFKELSVLGKGGFGVVVKARNKLDGCEYAIKIIMDKPQSKTNDKLLREVQALAQLSHPNIVRYHSTWLQLFTVPPHLWPKYHTGKVFTEQKLCQQSFKTDRFAVFESSPQQARIQDLSSDTETDDWEESSGGIVFADVSMNKTSVSPKKPNNCVTIVETGESSRESNADMALNEERDNGLLKSVISDSNITKSKLESAYISKTAFCSSIFKSEISIGHTKAEYNHSRITKSMSFSQTVLPSNAALKNGACKGSSSFSLSSSSSSSSCLQNKDSVVMYRQHPNSAKMTLFIQMGLCGDTLSEWITKRNNLTAVQGSNEVGRKMCLDVFRQILLAVQYIHSKNIVHRDLKPQNIFFSEDGRQIQLGDFGLARSLPKVSPSQKQEDLMSQNLCLTPILNPSPNTADVGTPIYAAPELRFGGNYGSASDLHNLGIILLELFHPFQTGSERVHVINDLKTRRYLDPEFCIQWPDIAPLILDLTSPDPSKRPAASELLNLKLFNDEILPCSREANIELATRSSTLMEETTDQQSFEASEFQNQFESLIIEELDVADYEASPELQNNQTFMKLQLANKEKDEKIKILMDENVKLREMVAKLNMKINQIGAVDQQQAAFKH